MPSVFISYRQTGPAQAERVRAFASRLRDAGVEVVLDQFYVEAHAGGPPEGWAKWCSDRAKEAEKILIIGNEDWFRCYEGKGEPGVGLGAASEARILRLRLHEKAGVNELARIVYFDRKDLKEAPIELRDYHHFDGQKDFDGAVRWIGEDLPSNPVQAAPRKPALGGIVIESGKDPRTETEVGFKEALPAGVKLWRVLRTARQMGMLGRLAWSPDGKTLAVPYSIAGGGLWDVESGTESRRLPAIGSGSTCVAYDPTGRFLSIGDLGGKLAILSIETGELRPMEGTRGSTVWQMAFDPSGQFLFSALGRDGISLHRVRTEELLRLPEMDVVSLGLAFDKSGRLLTTTRGELVFLESPSWEKRIIQSLLEPVTCLSPDLSSSIAVSGDNKGSLTIYDSASTRILRVVEGHPDRILDISFASQNSCFASLSVDHTVRIWNARTGDCLANIPNKLVSGSWPQGVAFHPHLPRLAVVGRDGAAGEQTGLIRIYDLDFDILLPKVRKDPRYTNAKVILVGDTGVGKSGLGLVLAGQPFSATDSTPGRKVWVMDEHEGKNTEDLPQKRETLLWDLAGQPGYRVIHQLHLNEVSVALVVFDSRSETDPLAGVRHWERALRLARQRQGDGCVPMKKFLVSARNDRGGVTVSKERLQALLDEHGFDGYFETSAKEGWQIKELIEKIHAAIAWDKLPEVVSSQLLQDIRAYLVKVKGSGRLLAMPDDLYHGFLKEKPDAEKDSPDLKAHFERCIDRLDTRDLIRRLSFGGHVLLQPELLDAYGSAMVIAAKDEPDGLGSIAVETALAGRFFVPPEQKIADDKQEQLLLHATVEELVKHDLALRETATDGSYLVFPSQFNRDTRTRRSRRARRWLSPSKGRCRACMPRWRCGWGIAASSAPGAWRCGGMPRSSPRRQAAAAASS